jgi:hypothetical protein
VHDLGLGTDQPLKTMGLKFSCREHQSEEAFLLFCTNTTRTADAFVYVLLAQTKYANQ